MAISRLRSAFPVLESTAYLNAGTCGPLPLVAAEAIAADALDSARLGRGLAYYDHLGTLAGHLRCAWGRLLGAPPEQVALTAGASDGIARVLGLIDWLPGAELLTSDEEHPGVLGPLGRLVRRQGVTVRTAPFDELASAVTPATQLVVVSHVSWLRGQVADVQALGAAGAPIVLDGAQAAGAVPVDLELLRGDGVVAYASAGQKWTCGPVGTGALWVDPAWAPDDGAGVWPVYGNFADPAAGLEATPWPDARRLDSPSLSCELLAGARASIDLLEACGWDEIHAAGVRRAARLAGALRTAGREVAERGDSTLVSWRCSDPAEFVLRAAGEHVAVRAFPGQPWVRASCGAWTSDEDVSRLLDLVRGGGVD